MASSDSWASILRTLAALAPSVSAPVSAQAEYVSISTDYSSSPNLIAKRREVDKRHALLLRALELHSNEAKHLSVLENRAKNTKLAINRLPIELLMMIFVETVALLGGPYDEDEVPNPLHPLSLAGVCHHWLRLIFSPTGARLWTRMAAQPFTNYAFLSAARRFDAWLPRSRPFTFDVSVSSITHKHASVRPVIDALLPHAPRCRSLGVSGLSYQKLLCPLDLNDRWTSLVHLTVGMIDDDDLVEDPDQRPPPFFLELPDESRHLESLTIESWFHPSFQSITSSLNAPSVCVGVKRLALRGVLFRFDCLVWLLRFFPNLISFEFRSEEDFDPKDDSLPQGTSLVPLPHLETIEFAFVHSVGLVLKALDMPNLKVLRVEGGDGLVPSELAPSLSRLEVLELVDPEVGSYDLAKSVCSPRALRSIHYYRRAKELQVGLDQLIEFARSPPSGSEAEKTPADEHANKDGRRRLDLFIGPSASEPDGIIEASSSAANDFVLQLDALGMMRQSRRKAYGSMFRIQVSPHLVEWWPAVAEVVQRHPDFLKLGELRSFETTWWRRS